MIEIPFYNDFYSIISPENKEEIIEHCLNASELPNQTFIWGEHCVSEKVYLKLTGFSELLKPYIIESLSEIVNIPYGYNVYEVWKNTYHRYYHQESHSHDGSELSFVIFMDDYKENDARFYFINERSRVSPGIWADLSSDMQESMWVDSKRGDILFFPSHMLHGVSPHKSDIPRMTVSGNIELRDLREG